MVEPTSLEEWLRDFIEHNTRIRSVDEWQKEQPDAPRTFVERFAEQRAELVRAFVARLGDHFADVHTVDELAQLSSAELFVRIVQTRDPIELLNRVTAAAYVAAKIPRPDSTPHPRPDRRFEIFGQERISDTRVDVHFRENGTADSSMWVCILDRSNQWRLLMHAGLLHLPGADVGYIDDPIVIAYLNQRYAN